MMTAVMTQISNKSSLSQAFGDRLQLDVPMARHTAARVGGPADGLLEVRSVDELVDVSRILWSMDTPFVILGGSSNVLVSDAGLRGVVVLNRARQARFDEEGENPTVWAESGANFSVIARQAAQRGLAGLEWAAGIPGTVGGAVVGNAGAHGAEMAGQLRMAEILHRNGKIETWTVDQFSYTYRSSVIKERQAVERVDMGVKQSPSTVVLSAVIGLEHGSPDEILKRIETLTAHRRRTQPPGASMGSMFKNPQGDYAGRLIDGVGLKGTRIGDAQISPLHANFFMNLGQATATDIKKLIDLAQQRVFDQFGVKLALEIELLGEW
jgi:UDP-N-acetylmuramate dehydrogenase